METVIVFATGWLVGLLTAAWLVSILMRRDGMIR